jgi:hypothetical protein
MQGEEQQQSTIYNSQLLLAACWRWQRQQQQIIQPTKQTPRPQQYQGSIGDITCEHLSPNHLLPRLLQHQLLQCIPLCDVLGLQLGVVELTQLGAIEVRLWQAAAAAAAEVSAVQGIIVSR